ncbi:type VI secretion system contractile sheath domain-containing protein [Desulfococcus sp.]|uniref:type VI secretion system contractile sheath domain-containing protein n=1 Tax=Desulfococcus sp. TaxID=2025834 RepID=UPI00359444D9
MPTDPSTIDVNIRLASSGDAPVSGPTSDMPFRIAVMGDFTGRMNRKVSESLRDRRPVPVDRDTCAAVLAGLSPELVLGFAGDGEAGVPIRIRELEDFHPERLFETLAVFQELRQVLRDLEDPRTVESAAARIASWTGDDRSTGKAAPPEREADEGPQEAGGGILDRILDEAEGAVDAPKPGAGRSAWDRFLGAIASSCRAAPEDPRRDALHTVVSGMISEIMRRILHHPDFQRLEALWRGVWQLVTDLETDEWLSIHLLDITWAELSADLSGSENGADSDIYRLLVQEAVRTPGAFPWAVAAGCYAVGSAADVVVLARMARISAAAGAPFLSAADSRLIGCASIAETPDPRDWRPEADVNAALKALRGRPEAVSVGLALPRFLVRMPYGPETDPVDGFDFEEMGEPPRHEDYLWGDPALFCLLIMGRSFSRDGWDLRPERGLEIGGLPLHLFREGGERAVKPCAEVLLTETAALRIIEMGIMPLLSIKNRDVVRLGRFQSLSDPPARLSGRWDAHE